MLLVESRGDIYEAMTEGSEKSFYGLRRKGLMMIFRTGSTIVREKEGEKYTEAPIRSGRRAWIKHRTSLIGQIQKSSHDAPLSHHKLRLHSRHRQQCVH